MEKCIEKDESLWHVVFRLESNQFKIDTYACINISISSFLNFIFFSIAFSFFVFDSTTSVHDIRRRRRFVISRLNAITFDEDAWKGEKRIETHRTRRASWIDLTIFR